MTLRVAVIGAGMAGLAAGRCLKQSGAEVVVFEQDAQVGGRAATVSRGDFVVDTGAILLSPKYTRTLALIDEVGLTPSLMMSRPVMGIARGGVVHELDLQRPLRSLWRWKALSTRAKMSMLRALPDLLRHWRQCGFTSMAPMAPMDGEDCRSYALRVLGREAHDFFVDPLIRVNMFTTSERTPAADLIWLLRMFSEPRVLQLRGGMNRLPCALAAGLAVLTGCEVSAVQRMGRSVRLTLGDGSVQDFDAAVLAVPPPVALQLAPWLTGKRRAFFEQATAIESVAVSVGVERLPTTRAAIVMVPSAEQPDLLGVVQHHRKADDRAPAGSALITLHYSKAWSDRHASLAPDALALQALRDATGVLGELGAPTGLIHVQRWRYVDYQRGAGCYGALGEMQREAQDERVAFAGEYISAGIEGAVISGEAAAAHLLSLSRR